MFVLIVIETGTTTGTYTILKRTVSFYITQIYSSLHNEHYKRS